MDGQLDVIVNLKAPQAERYCFNGTNLGKGAEGNT